MSEKTYRAWRPDQAWLLPPSPKDWLPEGHLVYILMDAVRELDISAITSYYERELRGYADRLLSLQSIGETTNLADKEPDRAATMKARLAELLKNAVLPSVP